VQITTIDPLHPAWADLVEQSPEATAFHMPAWAQVLRDTYQFQPEYLVALEGERAVAGIPLFRVGARLVGAPFSDFCPPLSLHGDAGMTLLADLKNRADGDGTDMVEIRGGAAADLAAQGLEAGDRFIRHVIPLHAGMEAINKGLHDSARRAVKKARREGIAVRVGTSVEDMKAFYQLNVLTRRKHGLIPQPWSFFHNIQRHHMAKGSGWLLLAEKDGAVIAGDLLLGCKGQLVYKFNASDPKYLALRPNNLLLYNAIEFGVEHGYRDFDLGRCEEENEGLRRFKLLWGSAEVPLVYYYYPAGERAAGGITANPIARKALPLFVRYAPGWALSASGALLYKRFA
jgi:CelD/BcsL family acetyltransferase involved in cellulose biosynthesis